MITIVDYQMGNLRSVQKAIERAGGSAIVTSDPHEVANSEALILPGVGGFGEAVAELRARDLEKPILDFLTSGKPFLGICLGLQLLFETGYEGGLHRGLGVLPGDVVRFTPADRALKVPHMGWNSVRSPKTFDLTQEPRMLDPSDEGAFFYFVHSYYVRPADPSLVALESDYDGPFCAMVQRGPLIATQFHPEKSQQTGLRFLRRFVLNSISSVPAGNGI